ncbi:MAG: hypothetical protein ACFFDT_00125 [Candidatus Hodarchaeota archaeon]
MQPIDNLHNSAMDLAEEAFILKKQGNENKAKELFQKAMELEQEAAEKLSLSTDSEPTRSILYRSAASLAYHYGDYETADRLVANGLAGYPPPEIREELKNLYEDINFLRHLSSKGIILDKNQWMMSISGDAISHGGTAAEYLLTRVEKVATLFYRTVERLLKLPYRQHGGVSKDIKEAYGLYIKAFAPGSFTVSFQVGKPDPQLSMFPELEQANKIEPDQVVDEILECFDIFEKEESSVLKEKIKEDNYYENFVALTKQIAPDGNNVKMVGFTSVREGKDKPVALRKRRLDIKEFQKDKDIDESKEKQISRTLTGILRHANSPLSGKYGNVKLTEKDTHITHSIKVPISIMKDVVQPFYEENVVIEVVEKKDVLYLEEIHLAG